MSQEHEGDRGSSRRRDVLSQRIAELGSHLKSNGVSSSGDIPLSASTLASSLFAKASFDFLEERSLAELSRITAHSLDALTQFLKGNRTLLLTPHVSESRTGFCIVMFDRPFIVSSSIEAIKSAGVTIDVFLHPVLTVQGARISLSYVEVDVPNEDALSGVLNTLTSVLLDLVLAAGDFTFVVERILNVAEIVDSAAYMRHFSTSENRDISEFLRWLVDDSFILLGFASHPVSKGAVEGAKDLLGLFKTKSLFRDPLNSEVIEDAQNLLSLGEPFWLSRLSVESPIHRRIPLTHIYLQEVDSQGTPTAVHSIVGIFSSKALSQEGSTIPVIKRKLHRLLESEEVTRGSHDYKFIVDIVDRMPKEEALRLKSDGLRDIIDATMDVYNRNETRLSVRFDHSGRGVTVLVVMPRDRLNEDTRRKIQFHLEHVFGGIRGSSEYYLDLSAHSLARFYFHIPLRGTPTIEVDVDGLEEEIASIARTWRDNLELHLGERDEGRALFTMFNEAFGEDYQVVHSADEADADVHILRTLTVDHPVRVRLHRHVASATLERSVSLYCYGTPLRLTQTLPILEHAGFEVLSESSFTIRPAGAKQLYIHRFAVAPREGFSLAPSLSVEHFEHGLESILLGRFDDDILTSLLGTAELPVRAIALLRAYTSLLWQSGIFPRKHQIREAVAARPDIATEFWRLFELKFSPESSRSVAERRALFQAGRSRFEDLLRTEKDILRDKTLRAMLTLLTHTARTNYYTKAPCIALKIHSDQVEFFPQPRPLFEIFVFSKDLEGVHLRSGMVSRGGLRWSERPDDFRTEVLGLMKTQKVKNVFIVPQGAKGGFIVRYLPKEREKVADAVRSSYQMFIRSLLSLADNRVGEEVVHPQGVVCFDPIDPYFVVAADKGTATFSDIANSIAVDEYSFWMGDAFASGGSNGYDHKKYGITAKGAWECVTRHFHDLGIDFHRDPFTTVGIGDMAGDVFGNGLILSDKAKLLAAFNHQHIFIDPDPDPKASFDERVRMFHLPRSAWTDYNPALISRGGGVFDRFQKEIHISPEARRALSLPDSVPESVNGEELIRLILKAEVDLLWNGGIGTYVKSTDETNPQVNDAANDRVRVDASELRCRVVGEGGNLGFTQAARVEFALRGGCINTDAIDNSGGVGLSDREVNLKILFSGLMQSGKVTLEERNRLLKEMAPSVVESVLLHNRNHAYRLTFGNVRSFKELEDFRSLIAHLVRLGYVNRQLDTLPEDEELYQRATRKMGLTRPELAVCLAAVKLWTKELILGSDLCRSPALTPFLLDYFPTELRSTYRDEILQHPLAPNIIATQVTNQLVDLLGITFFFRMTQSHSVEPIAAIRTALASFITTGARDTFAALARIDTVASNEAFHRLRAIVVNGMRDIASWFIGTYKDEASLDNLVSLHTHAYREAVGRQEITLSDADQALLRGAGIEDLHLRHLSFLEQILTNLESLWAAKRSGRPIATVTSVYRDIADSLGLSFLSEIEARVEPQNKWESTLFVTSIGEIRRGISHLSIKLLDRGITDRSSVEEALRSSPGYDPLMMTMNEMKNLQAGVPQVAVIARQLRTFLVT